MIDGTSTELEKSMCGYKWLEYSLDIYILQSLWIIHRLVVIEVIFYSLPTIIDDNSEDTFPNNRTFIVYVGNKSALNAFNQYSITMN